MGYMVGLVVGILLGCALEFLIASVGATNKKHDYYKEGYEAGYDKRCSEEEKYGGSF